VVCKHVFKYAVFSYCFRFWKCAYFIEFLRISSRNLKKCPAYYWRRRGNEDVRKIDQTPIYRNFFKKSVFWCLVSGMYIPSPILTRHRQTPRKQKQHQAIKNQTPLKLKFTVFLQFCCLVVSGLRLGESRYSVVCFLTCSWAILTLQRLPGIHTLIFCFSSWCIWSKYEFYNTLFYKAMRILIFFSVYV